MTLTEDIKVLQEIIVRELPRWIEERPELRRRLAEALGEALIPSEGREPAPPRMTYEEFLEWADEDTLAEWVDGEVVLYTPASKQHQDLAGFLASVMRMFVEQHDLGVVISAPFQMKLERGREPDLLFVAKEHLGRLKETYLEGPADLVVEIVSLEGEARDRGEKFYEYARGGVPEYWLIDPQARWAEFYRLKAGYYRTIFSGEEGLYRSEALPGFWLRVEWLWQEPLPDVARTAWEIIGFEGLRQLLAGLEREEE